MVVTTKRIMNDGDTEAQNACLSAFKGNISGLAQKSLYQNTIHINRRKSIWGNQQEGVKRGWQFLVCVVILSHVDYLDIRKQFCTKIKQ